ncbi:MAG: anti-sigma factor [Chthoniobacterales bacterium]|nr:anti-sigma factor [Chthoniobacterales bacterium]
MNEELEEQASLYVLGLLEGAEAATFERELETNVTLRAFVDELDEAAALVAYSASPRPLPPELRARVIKQVKSNKTVAFPQRLSWLPWAIAACLAIACSYLVAERLGLRSHITALEQRDFLAQIQIASLSSKLKNAPDANAVVVWDEKKQRGVLKVTQLPRNEADRDYQLWLVDPRYKNPIDGGVFHVANKEALSVPFQPASPVRGAKGFAISLERKGGVTKAEGPIVLLGK